MATAYLEITLDIAPLDRPAAAGVYHAYRQPFLEKIPGALGKHLLVRDQDVQVLHAFSDPGTAAAYLTSDMFTHDVVNGLKPFLRSSPEIRIYACP